MELNKGVYQVGTKRSEHCKSMGFCKGVHQVGTERLGRCKSVGFAKAYNRWAQRDWDLVEASPGEHRRQQRFEPGKDVLRVGTLNWSLSKVCIRWTH